MQIKKCLYINNEDSDLTELPKFIKEKVFNELQKNNKVIIFTDYMYNDLCSEMFGDHSKKIMSNVNYKNLTLEVCDYDESNLQYPLKCIESVCKNEDNLIIIWNIKNPLRYKECLKDNKSKFNEIANTSTYKNIENIVYIQNRKYNFKFFNEFAADFEEIILYHNDKNIIFNDKNEFYKLIDFICSYEKLRNKNKRIISFNKILSDIPMSFHKENFKDDIINKLMSICNFNFCCIYISDKKCKSIGYIDKCYGLTKGHKYYLFNDDIFIKFYKSMGKYVLSRGGSFKLHVDCIENQYVRDKFLELNIKTVVGISVYYNKHTKGVIWLGSYDDNEEIIDKDIKYIESICRSMFYFMQNEKKFCNVKQKVIQNEKLRTMEETAAGIAHDINNILTPIVGSVEILKEKYPTDSFIQKQLKIIEMCAYDATNIINKLKKDKNKLKENNVDIFNVNEIIIDAISLTRNKWFNESILKGNKIKVSTELNSKEKIQGNVTEIREVIINMISNAVDAIKNSGAIDISTRDDKYNVIIEITDDGIGINEQIENKIFDPFFTTKGKKGSGLGLSIVYQIIHSIGGTINCSSSKNSGTKFTIKIPIYNICKNISNKKLPKKSISNCRNILIIDDNVDVSNILCEIIKSITKYNVKSINPACMASIQNELKIQKYDIVICDFSMPNINGVEIAKKVRSIDDSIYFCLMTGYMGRLKQESLQYIDEILNKPLTKEIIQDFIYRYEKKSLLD